MADLLWLLFFIFIMEMADNSHGAGIERTKRPKI